MSNAITKKAAATEGCTPSAGSGRRCRKCHGQGITEIQNGPYWETCDACQGNGLENRVVAAAKELHEAMTHAGLIPVQNDEMRDAMGEKRL